MKNAVNKSYEERSCHCLVIDYFYTFFKYKVAQFHLLDFLLISILSIAYKKIVMSILLALKPLTGAYGKISIDMTS